ncbi:O-antigen ligase family protein [Planctomicrobium sp. SH668]|uniref:O-antigen ligase family protein n=1 Tax=Planctomicrobium sp. SH668 TaxID=3448126 RepID=UPI003F5C14D3
MLAPVVPQGQLETASLRLRSGWKLWWEQPFLLKLVDLGLISILILAPFLMGGRQAMGQLVLCFTSALTAILWSLHQAHRGDGRWRFTGIEPIMLLGLGLIALQCCQLSPSFIHAISPESQNLLPAWNETHLLLQSEWKLISFTPSDTWSNLVVIVACILFFFVLSQRLQTVESLNWYLMILAIGASLMALFGLAQFLFGNGKFFWVYEHPMTDTSASAKGAFTNANHFANYLAIAVPAQIYFILLQLHSSNHVVSNSSGNRFLNRIRNLDIKLIALSSLFGVTLIAILCSGSKPGMFAAFIAVVVMLAISWQTSLVNGRAVLIGGVLAILWMLTIPWLSTNENTFSQTRLSQNSSVHAIGRQQIWDANIQGIRHFPLAGTGLGSHHEVYWLWFQAPLEGVEYSHAENGYLQIAMETGLTGLGLVILLWLTSILWCAQGLWNASTFRTKGIIATAATGLFLSLIQSITDFVWYVPAYINVVLLYAVCAWRMSLMRFFETTIQSIKVRNQNRTLSRMTWICAIPLIALTGGWMVREKLPEVAAERIWDEYLHITLNHPGEVAQAPLTLAPVEQQKQRIELAIAAAEANPHSQKLQLHAGLACLNQFAINQQRQQRHMPLSQIRDAARSLFTSPDEMDQWLNRPGVLGEERRLLEEAIKHFRASLAACPLQPRPYLELAELVWLEGARPQAELDLVKQSVIARPRDARAHFALGRILWLNGEHNEAAEHWQYAFRQDIGYRGHLIHSMAAYVPARFFLDYFDPDHETLKQMKSAYENSEDHSGYQLVLETLGKSSIQRAGSLSGEAAESEWLLAHECFASLKDNKNAYRCGQEAVRMRPQSPHARQTFGVWLYKNGYYPDSIEHLSWCEKRRPNEKWISSMVREAQQKSQSNPEVQIAVEPPETLIR